jgi:hypothetical protein
MRRYLYERDERHRKLLLGLYLFALNNFYALTGSGEMLANIVKALV